MLSSASPATVFIVVPAHASVGVTVVTGITVGQLADREDVPCQLDQRARALLGIQPGVGRQAGEPHPVSAGAAARRLERTVEARLPDQHRVTHARRRLDQGARRGGADLLVGGDQQRDVRGIGDALDPGQHRDQPGLHVEDPRAARDVAVDRERPAVVPDRVGVPQKQDGRPPGRAPVQMVDPVDADQLAPAREGGVAPAPQQVERDPDALAVAARRLGFDERPQAFGDHAATSSRKAVSAAAVASGASSGR